MPTSDERLKILQMVQEGKISAEEGVNLMDALKDSGEQKKRAAKAEIHRQRTARSGSRFLRIRITDQMSGRTRVDVRLPLKVVTVGAKLGARFSPEVEGLDMPRLMTFVEEGKTGKVYDTIDGDDDELLEVFIE